jgi:hypothetical protein
MLNLQRKLFGFKSSFKIFQYVLLAISLQFTANGFLIGQDNSPYSRYGLGDLHPITNIYNRGMAGLSIAYSDPRINGPSDPRIGKYYPFINFSNPASYSRFFALKENNSKKLQYGRMLLDVGINFNSRTLREANNPSSFTSSNGYFSYLQVGVPLQKNWGLVFGIRPLSTISYKIDRNERLYDPNTGVMIDSAKTQFSGDGGSYLFNAGTGFAFGNLSLGVNAGFLFGKKDYSTRRTLMNDTVEYSASNHQTKSNFGGIFFNGGAQYRIDLSKDGTKYIQLGVTGNIQQKLNTRTDLIRETFFLDQSDGSQLRLDSVYEQLEVRGKLEYPANLGAGIIIEQYPDVKKTGWLLGLDFTTTDWDSYRFNGQPDAVRSNWQLKIGGQLRPRLKESYKSLIAYRAGMFFGDDYLYINNKKMSVWGISGGISLPIANLKDASRRFRTQYSIVNLSAEYIKRGNNDNPISENQFRVSVGFTLSDLWFTKRKYE